jgi:hypothetical protein
MRAGQEAFPVARQTLELTIRHKGWKFADVTIQADPKTPDELRKALLDAIRRDGWDEGRIGEFDMDVRRQGSRQVLLTFAR